MLLKSVSSCDLYTFDSALIFELLQRLKIISTSNDKLHSLLTIHKIEECMKRYVRLVIRHNSILKFSLKQGLVTRRSLERVRYKNVMLP